MSDGYRFGGEFGPIANRNGRKEAVQIDVHHKPCVRGSGSVSVRVYPIAGHDLAK